MGECSLFTMIYYFKQCQHEVCSECYNFENLHEYPEILCPVEGCGRRIMDSEIGDFAGTEVLKKVKKEYFKRELGELNFHECPCGQYIEVVPEEKVNYNHRKPCGAAMSKEHCEDLSKNRVLCIECKQDSCVACKEVPYHYSFTCQEYEEEVKYDRCRFCKDKIEKGNKFCNSEDCRRKGRVFC